MFLIYPLDNLKTACLVPIKSAVKRLLKDCYIKQYIERFSKVIRIRFGLAFLRYVIGWKNSRHFVIQSSKK